MIHIKICRDLFVVQAILLSRPGEGAIKFREVVVGGLTDDVPVELAQAFLILTQGVGLVQALLHFQVGLPVKVDLMLGFPAKACLIFPTEDNFAFDISIQQH